MTQQLLKQQQFDAVEFELKHSRDFQSLQNIYINYEVDSVKDDFGELFRVWNGHTLVGTFYKNADSKWVASPHYQNLQLIELDKDLSQTFDSSFEAVAYTQATYEGVKYAFACDLDSHIESVKEQSLVVAT